MSVNFKIALTPEGFGDGEPEEQATFGILTVRSEQESLTRGFDFFIDQFREGPLVSGYYAAEWFAWNWWRHSFEPRMGFNTLEWEVVHCMSAIGEGYVWPNVTLFSDGVEMTLISDPSSEHDAQPIRYAGSVSPVIVPLSTWEQALDSFISETQENLRNANVADTNLDRIWRDILFERNDPDVSRRRRLEAMLGLEPDSNENGIVEHLISDGDLLGANAIEEIAANSAHPSEQKRAPLTASEFEEVAASNGYETARNDCVDFDHDSGFQEQGDKPAWRLGVDAAQALRKSERLGDGRICDKRLVEMAGTRQDVLKDNLVGDVGLSFILDAPNKMKSRLVMRSKWKMGRRFDLARLIADRLFDDSGALHPATRAYTYRQKAQRAFAAEFLSPFYAVQDILNGDYDDDDARRSVARRFGVSQMTIEISLTNNRAVPLGFFRSTADRLA